MIIQKSDTHILKYKIIHRNNEKIKYRNRLTDFDNLYKEDATLSFHEYIVKRLLRRTGDRGAFYNFKLLVYKLLTLC